MIDVAQRIKAEVVAVDEKAHGVLVRYYTDALKNYYDTVEYPARYENVRAGRPNDTEAEIQAYIAAHYPMGHNIVVPLTDGMTQQQVIDEINARVNVFWIGEMERLRGPKPDFSVVQGLIGQPLSVTPPVVASVSRPMAPLVGTIDTVL